MSSRPSQFRTASKEALDTLRAIKPDLLVDGKVNRIALDVSLDGEDEIVSVRMHNQRLSWSCTCGRQNCGHLATALRWISAQESADIADAVRSSSNPPTKNRFSAVNGFEDPIADVRTTMPALSGALEDLVTAIVRIGTDAGPGPSVEEAIQRLIEAAPNPTPLGICRWVGRLKAALSSRDVDMIARILDGAQRLSVDLKTESNDPSRCKRIVSWLGPSTCESNDVIRISERNLVEIAREWLDGLERSSIERRYLVDLENGEIYREERARGSQTVSLGPCPRSINAGLVVVERGIPPQRIRLLQYSISAVIPTEFENQLSGWANRRFNQIADDYRNLERTFPGLSEPFVLVAPKRLDVDQRCLLLDEANKPLPIATAEDPTLVRYIKSIPDVKETAWFAGRLLDAQGTLMLRPLSVCIPTSGQVRHLRV